MRNWKKILGYFVGIALIVYLFATFHFDWEKLSYLSWPDFIWLSLLSILLLIFNGISLAPQLAVFGFQVSRAEVFMASQFYSLLNYLPLKAGLIGEGVGLNMRYGFPYKKFVGANVIVYGLNFFLYAITALVLLVFFNFSVIFPFAKPIYFIAFIAIFIGGLAIYFLLPKHLASLRLVSLLFDDREMIWRSKKQVFLLFGISVGGLIITALRLFFLFHILGYDISVAAAIMMSILASIAFLFGVTPGGIGIRETFMGVLSFFIFNDVGAGVVVSMIIRIFDFVWTAAFGAYAFHFLSKVNFFQKKENVQ